MGASRHDEEGDGQDGQGDDHRPRVVPPGRPDPDAGYGRQQQAFTQDRGRHVAGDLADDQESSDPRRDQAGDRHGPQIRDLAERPAEIGGDRVAGADPGGGLLLQRASPRPGHPGQAEEQDRHRQDQRDHRRRERPHVEGQFRLAEVVDEGRVSHPEPVLGHGRPTLVLRQGPGVVGIEGQVRVLAEGVGDPLDDGVEDLAADQDRRYHGRHQGDHVAFRPFQDRPAANPGEDTRAHDGRAEKGQRERPGPVAERLDAEAFARQSQERVPQPAQAPGQASVVQPGEGQAEQGGRSQACRDRGQHAPRIGLTMARQKRAAQDHEAHQEAQDPQLELGQGGHDRQGAGQLTAVLQQGAQAQQQKDRADRIGLAPDGAVEPGDGVENHDAGCDEGPAARRAELLDHDVHDRGQGQVGQDRHVLDGLAADPADEREQLALNEQEEQVHRRVVEEAGPAVEPYRPVARQRRAPAAERPQVVGEPGPWKQNVCDDEAEGQPYGKEDDDGRKEGARTARSRRRVPRRAGLSHARACQAKRPPGRALRWSGV